jgi:pimeloyl-ACP methyl ester carboxylesterase
MRTFLIFILCSAFSCSVTSQTLNLNKNDLYKFEGTYDLGNHRITLGIFDEFNHSLVYLDLKTLKLGALIPIDKNLFRENNDSSMLFSFIETNNNIQGLNITANGKTLTGKRVMPHVRNPISFLSNSNTLKGDLYLPAENGLHPVVIFAHGSGASTRSVAFFTTFFLQLGIGVLTFDKQGAGESMGNWETAGFDELADDIIAGINFLKTQKNINVKKIGVMGNSQGGWIGSMVTAKCKDVAFLLMRVGSGENVKETMLHEQKGLFIADGYKQNDVDEIVDMYRNYMNMAVRNTTWEHGDSIILSYKNKSWFNQVYPKPRVKTKSSENWWLWQHKNLQYDSYDYLKKVKVPTLWLLSEKDWNVNSQKSYPRIMDALQKAGNKDYTVKILPNMGHTGLIVKTGLYTEPFSWQYGTGFWDTMQQWLIKRKIAKVH